MILVGVDKDEREAVTLLERASYAGYPEAHFYMGLCFKGGIGTERNHNKAFAQFALGEMSDSADCMVQLGICYKTGDGCDQDADEAFIHFKKAGDTGYLLGRTYIGLCYKNGGNSLLCIWIKFHAKNICLYVVIFVCEITL